MANIKRLKRLVTVLERVRSDPKKKREFDLSVWAHKTPDCGTHLCACGWGAIDPVLNSQGLRLGRAKKLLYSPGSHYRILRFMRHSDMEAAEHFFSITDEQAAYLFSPYAYAKASAIGVVIRRLKSVVSHPDRRPPKSTRERLGYIF